MEHLNLLNRNSDLFKKMKLLALDQEQLILNDKIDDFMNLVSKRRKIKEEISSNRRRYEKILIRQGNKEAKSGETSVSKEIAEVIQSIQETDKRIEELLNRNKDSLFEEIRSLKNGKRVLKGYSGKGQKSPRFIDQRG